MHYGFVGPRAGAAPRDFAASRARPRGGMFRWFRPAAALLAAVVTLAAAAPAEATVYRMETVLGDILIRLLDTATPNTVANFRSYADDGDWDNTFIHRSVPGFVVQGGGFSFDDAIGFPQGIPSDPPVVNEPGISNLRGTVAMAKLGGDPNSATNQWFFNLGDNSANLDFQNGGFTAFGRVVGGTMTVVDQIAALPIFDAGQPFDTLPLIEPEGTIDDSELVNITAVTLLDIPAGDYNFDGVVDAADVAVFNTQYGSTTDGDADGNGDGVVDAADFTILVDSMAVVSAIPEPATVALLVVGLLVPVRRR